jgi:hypothetical protein
MREREVKGTMDESMPAGRETERQHLRCNGAARLGRCIVVSSSDDVAFMTLPVMSRQREGADRWDILW